MLKFSVCASYVLKDRERERKERKRERERDEKHGKRYKSIPRMESGGFYVFIPADVLINCLHTHTHTQTHTHTHTIYLPLCVFSR